MSQTKGIDVLVDYLTPTGMAAKFVAALTGILAVLVAIKAAAYTGAEHPVMANQDHYVRLLAFAALTVWTTLTLGLNRRGEAAMVSLAFACFLEMVIVPARGEAMGTLVSANLGIVIAYCAMHLFWLSRQTAPDED